MNVTIINGNQRHGSTWHAMELFIKALERYDDVKTTEFSMCRDMPLFRTGCFSCFMNGEETCPHAQDVTPIVRALEEADLIILTSPVYGLDVSAQLKALLDHLCFMWFIHRPNPRMFNKIGLSMTTTAGAGLKNATKTMRNNLVFWGLKRVYHFKIAVAASKWDDVKERKIRIIEKKTDRLAKRISRSVRNVDRLANPLFRSILFRAVKGMMKKNTWSPRDKAHWQEQGWLTGTRPF
jgi:multimeric flavodoxin WrbA